MSNPIDFAQWIVWAALMAAYGIAFCERVESLITGRRRPSVGSLGLVWGLQAVTGLLMPM